MERTKSVGESKEKVSRTHEIKEHPAPFAELAHRRRAVEVRLNDRDYQAGDRLIIREYDPRSGVFTNAFVTCYVRSVTTARDWGGMLEGLIDPRVAILGLAFPEDVIPVSHTDAAPTWAVLGLCRCGHTAPAHYSDGHCQFANAITGCKCPGFSVAAAVPRSMVAQLVDAYAATPDAAPASTIAHERTAPAQDLPPLTVSGLLRELAEIRAERNRLRAALDEAARRADQAVRR